MAFEAIAARRPQLEPRPLWYPSKKASPLDMLVRAGVVEVFARARGMGYEQAYAHIAKQHPRYNDELTKLVCRAATHPATTYEEGWLAEVLVAMAADLIKELMPRSAFAQLAAQGMQLQFGIGEIMVPNFMPSAAGAFVRQGEPIPVVQGQTTGQILSRKKMTCIITYTGELAEGAIVTMEGLLRTRIQESTSVTLDSVLLDDQPQTDARPAGLLNGGIQVTSSGALQSDLQLLAEGLFAAAHHHVRTPVLIANTAQAFAARMALYRSEVIQMIVSPSIEPGTVIMLDAADFTCAGGQLPRFEISKEAALHFEDETPEHINASGVMAAPVRSLWQTETLGLRMILEIDWHLRRPGLVAYMRGVHWEPR